MAIQQPLSGISFDVESTLLVYNDPQGRDAANYVLAVQAYNKQVEDSSQEFHPSPRWLDIPEKRKSAFNNSWVAAEREFIEVLSTTEDRHLWDAGLKSPWGAQPDQFFHRVCDLFFETECPASYIHYLVHVHYVSRAVYHLPLKVNLLRELKEKYPQLPLLIVSNTDARVVKATRMFEEYASLFPESVFFHASNMPELKPSPKAIAIAAASYGVTNLERWLHVGDDKVDRDVAAACGCLFFHCDKDVGVDFESLLTFVDEQQGVTSIASHGTVA
jgi:phosphoglycolate phosphatase-like HAD superfamily hydrolase